MIAWRTSLLRQGEGDLRLVRDGMLLVVNARDRDDRVADRAGFGIRCCFDHELYFVLTRRDGDFLGRHSGHGCRRSELYFELSSVIVLPLDLDHHLARCAELERV